MGILADVDEELIPALPQFFDNVDEDISELEERLDERNGEEIESVIHRIKGYAGSWGLEKMHEVAVEFENNAKRRNWEAVEEAMEDLRGVVEEAKQAAGELD